MVKEPALNLRAPWAALALTFALAMTADAENDEPVKRVLVRITKVDGRIMEQSQPLEKAMDGVHRLKIPIKDITRDIDAIDIISADATAKQGEEGYFVLSTGVMGTFREKKANLKSGGIPCRSSV